MLINSHGHSDVGFVREKNEDSFLTDDERGIYAVADGVGGLPFGALASKLAIQFFQSSIQSSSDFSSGIQLRELAHTIHQNIVACGQVVSGESGIGCTVCKLWNRGD